ncbi:CubicO group peptidase (beta-lactamase class C family) [Flavobacterium cutihirudinis]|uniref:CubicO group peptidase (Beta-lactamase class C family) n=1 Tax=Flavobacterium cutihirudinis TaxID=1265740 RepID=A0A3D9FKL2_9FLAO|nr:serine hydrolase domain-containing protein [Flavobacterium cutihirudinis]RED19719.1 CubicO group peptidase (beta-lactamase class C family) [Flavobacterium cutihirudinis]
MKKQVFLYFTVLLFTSSISAQELKDFFSTLNKNDLFNGSVLISKSGENVFSNFYGYSNIEKKEKINEKSQFTIASVSKTFTSVAILQLKQKGKLNIDDPVQKYLLDFPYSNISIRHLLSHTSGLTQYYRLFDTAMKEKPEKTFSNEDIIPALIENKVPLSFAPGDKWEYNNVNYCLAALVVEKITGISFRDYLEKNIFEPAKMKDSFLPKNRRLKTPNQVELYTYPNFYSTSVVNVQTLKETFLIDEKSNFYGPGGIVSTALDLYKYQKALFSYQLLGKKELEEALTPAKLNDGKIASYRADEKEIAYGLGWQIFTNDSNEKIVFHDGLNTGLTSILMHNITKNHTVILLSNTASPVFATANAALKLIENKPYKMPLQSLSRIYGSLLESGSKEKANQLIEEYLKKTDSYEASERDFNRLGYQFLRLQKTENSLVTFAAATLIFPNSSNIYDSYGEVLLQSGKKEDAIKMYQKSVELNPANENGKKVLKELL